MFISLNTSEATRKELNNTIAVRCLGKFLPVGKTQPTKVFEVLGLATEFNPPPAWVELFARALEHFNRREWDACELRLREVLARRGGEDGPARFYLSEVAKLRSLPAQDATWDGVVVFDSK